MPRKDPAASVPDDLEDMHRRGKLGPSLPITPPPAGGILPAAAPAFRLTEAEAQYVLALLEVDAGENADGVDVGDLHARIAAANGLCGHCQGVTGTTDCPTCHGDGYVEAA